ncbi:MAG: TolC family protein [Elusimicrobia bacterium]|nr:TolC family protein [Elusimicrobiota bacterium]
MISYTAHAVELTLEEALASALENNQEIRIAQSKVEAAGKEKISSMGNFLPTLSAAGTLMRPDQPQEMFPGAYTPDNTYNLTATAQLPLFTGGRNISLMKNASLQKKIAEANLLNEENKLRQRVLETFYRTLLSEKILNIQQESEKRLRNHYKQAEILYKNGLASRFDLLRAEVQLSNLAPLILQSKNAVHSARANLALLTGIKGAKPSGQLDYVKTDFNLEDSFKKALENRPDLQSIELTSKMAKTAITLTRSQGLPYLAAAYNLRYDHPYQGKDEWGDSWVASLTLNIPIFRGFSTLSDTSQARAQQKQALLSYDLYAQVVMLEVETAYYSLVEEEGKIEALRKTLSQAKEALSIAQTHYKNGLISNLEFMDTDLSFMQAQVSLMTAYTEYKIAAGRLITAVGGD